MLAQEKQIFVCDRASQDNQIMRYFSPHFIPNPSILIIREINDE